MARNLKVIYYRQIAFFLLAIGLITFLSYFLYRRDICNNILFEEANHELDLYSQQLNFSYLMNLEHLKAQSSRTMIRKELYKWYNREITFKELQDYSNDKLIDGISVYDKIIYSERLDIDLHVIFTYGEKILQFDYDALLEMRNNIFLYQEKYYLLLINDIVHNEEIIGYDIAIFCYLDLSSYNFRYISDLSISKLPENDKDSIISPIGNTQFNSYASISPIALDNELRNYKIIYILQAIALMIVVFFVSYLTILKSTRSLIGKLEAANSVIKHQERFSAFGQVTGNLIHEFSNHLTGILGFAELLSEEISNDQDMYLIENIIEYSNRSNKLLHQLHDFSKKKLINKEKTNLIPFLKSFVKELSSNESIYIRFDYTDDNIFANIDTVQIKTVISDIIENSKEANSSKVKISICKSCLPMSAECSCCHENLPGNWTIITIEDNGKGLNPESLQHALVPFYTTKSEINGLGLGLSQAYGIMRQHKGHIIFENTEEGAMISLLLKDLKCK